jgi:hypothetical protein
MCRLGGSIWWWLNFKINRDVIPSAATAGRGTSRRPTLLMPRTGLPPLHAVRRSSHQYDRCPSFVRSLRRDWYAPAG